MLASTALARMGLACLEDPPLIRLLFNLTAVQATFLDVLPIALNDIVFGTDVASCL